MTSTRRALILVDVQQEYFEGPLAIQYPPASDALKAILEAVQTATEAALPVAVVQHNLGDSAPVFNPTTSGYGLHPAIEQARTAEWKHADKSYASAFVGTDLAEWIAKHEIDTVTLAGFMTNNCTLATAADCERLGFTAEVLSDATGAINIANSAGFADARTVHTTLLALLNSNWAAVATTADWRGAVLNDEPVPVSNLVASAMVGASLAQPNS